MPNELTAPRRAAIRERLDACTLGALQHGFNDCSGRACPIPPFGAPEGGWIVAAENEEPFVVRGGHECGLPHGVLLPEYAELFANAPSDLAYLLAACERLEGENAALRELEELARHHVKGVALKMRRSVLSSIELHVAKVLRELDAAREANAERGACDHTWIDARNAVVTSGEYCAKCGAIRATQTEQSTPHADGAR